MSTSGISVFILGTAQDGGYPHVGCTKDCCLSAWNNPSIRRMVSSIALIDENNKKIWIVDVTPDIKSQLYVLKKYYSWILYDWANSAYATVVLVGFFPIIFADYYATEFLETTRTLLLGIANSTASLLLIVFAPFLGLMADRRNNRKLYLIIFASAYLYFDIHIN